MVRRATKTAPAAEGTRDRIIATAATHLAKRGPRGVELRAVCNELGIAPSLVNYYFASPGEVIWSAAVLGYRQHVERQTADFAKAADAEAALRAWVGNSLEWTKANPGIAAVIDFPVLALGTEDVPNPDDFVGEISSLSRTNVATLGSAVWALMTGSEPKQLSSTRIAAAIKLNADFAYWVTTIGFSTMGAAMWIAGRKPYSILWRAFGFDPDSQAKATLDETIARITAKRQAMDLPPGDPELEEL